jgi:hypothetical protein
MYSFARTRNERGELTFFRAGPMREIAEAIARNDSRTVASLVSTVDVNKTGLSDMTLLLLAARQLRQTPEQHEVLRVLLAARADPNKGAQYELPLAIAIQQSGRRARAGEAPARRRCEPEPEDVVRRAGVVRRHRPVFDSRNAGAALDRGADVNAHDA